MKKTTIPLLFLVLISCGTNKSNNKKNDAKADSKIETLTSDHCDEFLDDYEEWIDEVLEVYKKVKENPMDVQNTQKLLEVSEQMTNWSEKWTGLLDCANDEDYAKRMEALEERVNNAMNP